MLLDLSDLSNLLTVRFVKFKILGSSVKGVSPSFLAELQSKTINSPQKRRKKQELTLASRDMVLSLLYLLKYWPRPDRTRLRTSWKIINLHMHINRLELPRPLSGPRMCSGHSRCSRCSSYASVKKTQNLPQLSWQCHLILLAIHLYPCIGSHTPCCLRYSSQQTNWAVGVNSNLS